MISRRGLLTGGLAAVALAAAGAVYEWLPDAPPRDPAYRYAFLNDEDRVIVAAVAPVMLGRSGVLPDAVRGLDVAIAGLPPEVQKQVRTLFGLLAFPLSRMFVAGIWHPWHAADSGEIARFLQSWRTSPFAQLRSAYDALHQLIMAAWYGQDRAWAATGYPGPPAVPR